ncbi:RnfH family protein [Saccharospirillum sp. MSK14-1]|uniref:RnfH family protein n=1 Tax=Saccharospirillum sp. MSK14-1 TaxID=1897632 RepID=UPI000D349892|nr:RnfH family protein [Saccharospirillum sp. MSK14-1]PTY38103.1 RnfH family protein [Saccharospirillum sp. MSK14-1]
MADAVKTIAVEVAFATPEKQLIVALDVPVGTNATEAVRLSGIDQEFPEENIPAAPLGIFGRKLAEPEKTELSAGDRVEIYRPLLIDPKQARLNRAAKARES